MGNREIEAQGVGGYPGKFKFVAPRFIVKDSNSEENLELPIEFTLSNNLEGFSNPQRAILVFDWNGDYTQNAPSGRLADKYTAKSVITENKYSTDQVVFKVEPKFTFADKNNMQSVTINNTEYPIEDFSIDICLTGCW